MSMMSEQSHPKILGKLVLALFLRIGTHQPCRIAKRNHSIGNLGSSCFRIESKIKLVEHGSDPCFPRARASEYSTERGQAYLLSSEWVQELPCRYGRHIRLVNSNEVNGSFETMSKLSESSESNRG